MQSNNIEFSGHVVLKDGRLRGKCSNVWVGTPLNPKGMMISTSSIVLYSRIRYIYERRYNYWIHGFLFSIPILIHPKSHYRSAPDATLLEYRFP